jgi:hypothetical protein
MKYYSNDEKNEGCLVFPPEQPHSDAKPFFNKHSIKKKYEICVIFWMTVTVRLVPVHLVTNRRFESSI